MSVLAIPAISISTPVHKERSLAAWMFVLVDAMALEVALLLGVVLRQVIPLHPVAITPDQYKGVAFGLLIIPLAYYFVGLYPGYGMSEVQRLKKRVGATVLAFVLLLGWDYIFQERMWSRGILLATLVFALVFPPVAVSYIRHWLTKLGWCGAPVLILGASRTGALVARTLREQPSLGFVPVAFFDDDPSKWHSDIEGLKVLGPLAGALSFPARVRIVVLAMPGVDRERLTALVHGLSFPHIIVIPDWFGIQSLWIEARDLGGVLGLEINKNLLLGQNRMLKHTLDYALAIPLALVCFPLILFLAGLIRLVSPGSPFYSQTREGAGGRRIQIWKLRTMHRNAEQLLDQYLEEHPCERAHWERHFKLTKDPRILPWIGRFLRRTSLDELPQLWNVLKRDMSLVGPRPFPYYHQESFRPVFRNLRCSVLPGLTGLWQVSARGDGDLEKQELFDTYYIRNWSLWLDLYILGRTVEAVLFAKGAY
ncbi:MAG TPA: exopolysaccharide biosynthesis polyprenyl glycosylphosphotransferase [Bryobacteraceae bacterium]|nr:exopolysaccharide biosynthesis polyprenyl glycosylphosphotransferase [Bryobacteraceae bacterium]